MWSRTMKFANAYAFVSVDALFLVRNPVNKTSRITLTDAFCRSSGLLPSQEWQLGFEQALRKEQQMRRSATSRPIAQRLAMVQ